MVKPNWHFYIWLRQKLFFILLVVLSSPAVQGQVVDVNIDINATTLEGAAVLTIPDGIIKVLRITAYDPDFPDEGQLFVNDMGPISLFPGGSGANDGLSVDIDIRLSEDQKAWFLPGDNTLRFVYVQSAGFIVERIAAIGDIALIEYPEIQPLTADGDISMTRQKALHLYKRIVGISTPIDNPILDDMESAIAAGNLSAAAQVATSQPGFYNNVVRDFAAKMSTREETVKAELNDFIATVIGAVRDERDARTLLTGQYFYRASDNTPVPSNMVNDILSSNTHYQTLEKDGYDLASVLVTEASQYVKMGSDNYVESPDPAGVITSRAFMEAHATAGTNRRLVEYTMRAFTCNPIENWSDNSSPDNYVGRDVDRFPGGDGGKFQTTCKACHANMDGFRGAFARYNFADGFVKYASLLVDSDGEDGTPQSPSGIVAKMNQNSDVFPAGHMTIDDGWQNFARSPGNQNVFGWRGDVSSGAGVGQFAHAIADTQAFSQCMVKRVFREVCRRDPAGFERDAVKVLAATFEAQGYNLKKLFETVAIRTECLGE